MLLRTLIRFAVLLGVAGIQLPLSALEISWQRMPGTGKDVSVGADGSVFVVGNGDGNEPVYRWNGSAWENRGGSAVLIAVGPNGAPWTVDKYSNMAHFENGQWQQIVRNKSVTDVAVGTNGAVYTVGGAFCNCGKVTDETMYRLDGTNFVSVGIKGVVIHPDPAGNLWSVDASTAIHRSSSSGSSTTINGHALDMAISAAGEVWIISRTAFDGNDGDVQVWNGSEFVYAGQFGVRIAVTPDGIPWVITDDNRIYRGRPVNLKVADTQATEGQVLEFAVSLSVPAQKVVTADYRLIAPLSEVGTNSPVVATGRITLQPGQTNTVIRYQLPNDSVYNPTRLYSLSITNATGANPPAGTGFGRVVDDEPVPPTLKVATALAVLEGQTLEFPLTLAPAAPQDILITYEISGPTNAPATNQGTLASGSILLPAGATNGVIRYSTPSNNVAETDRTFRVQIITAPGASIQVGSAAGPVLDDDAGNFSLLATLSASTVGAHFQARVVTRANFEYTLERRVSLNADGTDGIWTPIAALTGSGGEIILANPDRPTAESYYRISARRRL